MRIILPAALALMVGVLSQPALAGPAETAFLGKLVGAWSGTGAISGDDTGAVACAISFKLNGAKLLFAGRCTEGNLGPPQAINGSITYNDATKKYEARGNGQVSIGTKSGRGLSFATKIRNMGATGTSVMKLSAKAITIDADFGSGGMGGHYKSHIVLSK